MILYGICSSYSLYDVILNHDIISTHLVTIRIIRFSVMIYHYGNHNKIRKKKILFIHTQKWGFFLIVPISN